MPPVGQTITVTEAPAAGDDVRVFVCDRPLTGMALERYPDREARDEAMAEWLAAHGVRLVVCAGYMHLLRSVFLDRFPGRVINVHPSNTGLPDWISQACGHIFSISRATSSMSQS